MSKPIIALANFDPQQPPTWLRALESALGTDYTLAHYEREGYVTRLADEYAALILVNGEREDWLFWTATPRSSPATRRIPIFLVGGEITPERALRSGADLLLSAEARPAELRQQVADFARVFDAQLAAQLECECHEPLPPLAEQGLAQFNAGEYYKQHDSFEELWMATDGPVRDLYRAILQVGVAYFQVQRGNHRGALKMLLRSVQWLRVLPDACQGIDVAALREDSYRVRAALESMPASEIDQFDQRLLKPIKRTPA